MAFENIMGKGENASYKHFSWCSLPFPGHCADPQLCQYSF